jgi:hypothetical protein
VVLPVWIDRGVEENGMGATVPADLDESDELPEVERADPGECMFLQPLRPRLNLVAGPTECPSMQDAELPVVDGEAGYELDRHGRNATAFAKYPKISRSTGRARRGLVVQQGLQHRGIVGALSDDLADLPVRAAGVAGSRRGPGRPGGTAPAMTMVRQPLILIFLPGWVGGMIDQGLSP